MLLLCSHVNAVTLYSVRNSDKEKYLHIFRADVIHFPKIVHLRSADAEPAHTDFEAHLQACPSHKLFETSFLACNGKILEEFSTSQFGSSKIWRRGTVLRCLCLGIGKCSGICM